MAYKSIKYLYVFQETRWSDLYFNGFESDSETQSVEQGFAGVHIILLIVTLKHSLLGFVRTMRRKISANQNRGFSDHLSFYFKAHMK